MIYNTLTSDLLVYNSGYDTLERACEHLENQADTANVVRYVEDEGGNLVALVYAGASWFPGERDCDRERRLAEGVKDV